MNFDDARRLGACLSRDYAGDLFRLLVNYRDISASEAASRLNLHIRTAQDFLETLNDLGVLSREEVFERKRPYFRYALASNRIRFDLDLVNALDYFHPNAAGQSRLAEVTWRSSGYAD